MTESIYASFQYGPFPDSEQALVLWVKAKPGWVEIRGWMDVSLDDPLQQAIDGLPASQVSGLMSNPICVFTPTYPLGCYAHLSGLLQACP
jgi:hypothetical protein